MDEILSSIRQIIADDDEAASKTPATPAASAKPVAASPAPAPEPEKPSPAPEVKSEEPLIDPFSDDDDEAVVPLELSPEQIVAEEAVKGPAEDDDLGALDAEMPSAESLEAAAGLVVPDDVAFEQDDDPEPAAKAQPRVSEGAPMPDESLSSDLADELLEPATQAAVRGAFSKLNTQKLSPEMPLGASGLTIEAMIREMLRPMLKEWLDENLPTMVERIVTQEIERVSRGGN
ncbi:DUF2497 domain-containing protein [Pelagibacterium xiamenense]|uniref:DUF2497 domain-containing protein n=1 Tax=Pelagibacterium xiamenense TaxID=2901140 RepID=UPI001E462337|nr:DUF2497 domain-containing protein [Pelagibacterium xiamenense]MCD7061067.1 DUF2497 domain-containing protein [Pelagibacterium xiamenense]